MAPGGCYVHAARQHCFEDYAADVERAETMVNCETDNPMIQHYLVMKKVRVINNKDQVVWEGSLAEYKKYGDLIEGERLAASKASKRRIRQMKMLEELQNQPGSPSKKRRRNESAACTVYASGS